MTTGCRFPEPKRKEEAMQTGTYVSLNRMGKEAVNARNNIIERYNLTLPKPSRILVKLDYQGKFTVATVRAKGVEVTGVAARHPSDKDKAVRGNMEALTRALKKLGTIGGSVEGNTHE